MIKSIQFKIVASVILFSFTSFGHEEYSGSLNFESQSGFQASSGRTAFYKRNSQKRKKRYRSREVVSGQQPVRDIPKEEMPPVVVVEEMPPVVVVEEPAPVVDSGTGSGSGTTGSTINFQKINTEVMQKNCTECHSSYSKYATVKNQIGKILSFSEGGHGNLTNDQLDMLRSWIASGMPEN